MTPADLDRLEALARAATGGKWTTMAMGGCSLVRSTVEPHRAGRSMGIAFKGGELGYSLALPFYVERTRDEAAYYRPDLVTMSHEDAAFIAAANPSTVLRLIAGCRRKM